MRKLVGALTLASALILALTVHAAHPSALRELGRLTRARVKVSLLESKVRTVCRGN